MSEITLDLELCVEGGNSISVDHQSPKRVGPRHMSRPTRAPSLYWGFDEQVEKESFERIQKRLIQLEAALFEEYGARIDTASRDGLNRLFVSYPSVRPPLISTQPDGVLIATWKSGLGEELVVKCSAANVIHYSIIVQVPGGRGALNRSWGTSHTPSVFFAENPVARRIAI